MENPGRLAYYEDLTEKRGDRTEWTGAVNFVPEALEIPLKWRKPRRIFVNSMSDLFHESVSDEWLDQIFAVMALTPHHTYQVLTKRPERMAEYCNNFTIEQLRRGADAAGLPLPPLFGKGCCVLPNVWLGVTVENQKAANDRIPLLLQTPAALRFLSCEPLLERIQIDKYAKDLDWVIVGGESGPGARSCDIGWIDSIVQDCRLANKPVFVKQLGSKPVTNKAWPVLDRSFPISDRKGAIVSEFPIDLQIRQFPEKAHHGH